MCWKEDFLYNWVLYCKFWEWISLESNPELLDPLAASLGLPVEYVRRHQGAWLVNITKQSNYNELTTSDKKVLNDQLDEMIKNKYTFLNPFILKRIVLFF